MPTSETTTLDRAIRHLPAKSQLAYFKTLPQNQQGFFLLRASKHVRQYFLSRVSDDTIAEAIAFLDPDQASNTLQTIKDKKRREKILHALTSDLKDKVKFLMRFNPDSAASIMDLNYIEVTKSNRFRDVATLIEEHESRTGKIPAVLVVEDGLLIGELPIPTLVLESDRTLVKNHVKAIKSISYRQSTEDVIRIFTHAPHTKIAVLDDNQSILGIIYSDDIIRIIEKNSGKNLYDFAGVKQEENVFDPFFVKVKYRYKWLIINLGTAYLAAGVVSLFEDTISKFVLLATYMPIVAGMGGNAGTQTLAVTVRGIALGEIELKHSWRAIMNEIGAGFINGCINGVIVAIIAVLWNQSPLLGLITSVAMIVNLAVAGLAGSIIPLIMKKLGKDPATSATIFITTATDVCGFFTFLGLATILLK